MRLRPWPSPHRWPLLGSPCRPHRQRNEPKVDAEQKYASRGSDQVIRAHGDMEDAADRNTGGHDDHDHRRGSPTMASAFGRRCGVEKSAAWRSGRARHPVLTGKP